MIRDCANCGQPFEALGHWQKLCKPCWREQKDRTLRDAAWSQGYADGYRDGRLDTLRHSNGHGDLPMLPNLLDLIQLCHPDRHPPERGALATRVTAALIGLKEGGA
jgi:hypothetical protein